MIDVNNSGSMKKAGLHKKRRLKKNIKIILILLSVLAAVYFGGVVFFSFHYLFNTVIDGNDFSLKTAGQAEDFLREKTGGYILHIVGREGAEDFISADEIDIKNVFDGSLQRIISEQNKFGWMLSFWKNNEYHIENLAEYNEEKLKDKLRQLKVFENAREPEDAYIGEFFTEAMQYPLVEEDRGTVLSADRVREVVSDALSALNTQVDLDGTGCYKEPAITSENPGLKKILSQLNGFVSARVIYDWHGIEEIVDGNLIKDWLVVDGDKVDIDEEAIREYINSLSRKYDMFGRKRTFRTAKGEEIEIDGGAYGWRVNRSEEADELIKLIRQRAVISREPVYLYTAYHKGEDDIGNSYVEIDLTNQHLYLFIDGELTLESDFVSGNISRGYGTPTGIYGLTYKERNTTLKGENYASKVSYWMPFNGNVGMHDAGWRNKFGGKIYRTNGSHGCINLPKDKAETIYSYVEKNFPVICYKSKEEKLEDDRNEDKQEPGQDNVIINEPQAGEVIESGTEGVEQPGQGTELPVEEGTQPQIGEEAGQAEQPQIGEESGQAGQPQEITGMDE